MQFSRRSVEFRLLCEYTAAKDVFQFYYDSAALDRLGEIAALSAMGKATEESRTRYLKFVEEQKRAIMGIIDPMAGAKEREAVQAKASEVDKAAYLQAMTSVNGGKGFKDLRDISQAMQGLNSAILETKKD